ncbi:MAG TPA: J domain-containing protein [Anaerolineae bacterium]|nr:J domain-containing protein [Anaerolineae bacterium]HQI86917.1 J domain-containing protein [Anaerolineae bacterium]
MASKAIKDYYAILGIPQNATAEQVRAAYRHMARINHPDINTAPDAGERFREVNEAYEILGDPEKRKAYDFFAVANSETPTVTPPPAPPYPAPTSAAPAPVAAAAKARPTAQRVTPPTWAILLIMLGIFIIAAVGVGALLSLQRNRATGGADSASVVKLTTFSTPPVIPAEAAVVQESGTPVLTVRPKQLDIAGTIYPVVAVLPEQGRWPIPHEQRGIAVWLYGTVINYVVGVPYVATTESLLAGLTSAQRITLTLDNGSALVFGSPQTQRIAAEDLSPMAQDRPGLTLMMLDSSQTSRLIVQARYLPEESIFSQDQKVDGLKFEVLEASVREETDTAVYFVIEYQVTNESGADKDAAFFDLVLEDSNGQRYTLDDAATTWGKYGRLNRVLVNGEIAMGSAGYQVPRTMPSPATWIVRSDATSANNTRFAVSYEPPQPAPPQPDVELSDVFDDVTRNVIVINGTIYNDGKSPLIVTLANINLTYSGGASSLQASTPLLPWNIGADGYQEFEVQFSRPTGVDSVLLEILGFTFRIEGLE